MYTYSYLGPKKMSETGRSILQGVGGMTAEAPKDVVAHISAGMLALYVVVFTG